MSHVCGQRLLPLHRLHRKPVLQKSFSIVHLEPSVYDATTSSWTAHRKPNRTATQLGDLLQLVSWNMNIVTPAAAARMSAALEELRAHFTARPAKLVVMFQEIRDDTLHAIMANPWVRTNFVLSNREVLPSSSTYAVGKSFVMTQPEGTVAPHFTLMMISKDMTVVNCFRSPLLSSRGRDALVVDIAIRDRGGEAHSTKVLRLCTTHLESRLRARHYHLAQLSDIAALLKGVSALGCTIVGGIVGGDMNAYDNSEHELHKTDEVYLRDAWEDDPPPPPPPHPPPKSTPNDLTYGRAQGNTWGYQTIPRRTNQSRRLDKFFYTGSVEPVAIHNIGDLSGKIGRIGIKLEIGAEVWERCKEELLLMNGRVVKKKILDIVSDREAESLLARRKELQMGPDPIVVRKSRNIWVSDHFGIVVGIKIL
ncbi:MAG: hypothetical protein Q9168_005365 [Polycauliona sp. 1 TL-2023]